MQINIDLNSIISAGTGAILGGSITYFTFFSKAKKEQRAKIIGKTMEQRRDVLIDIKNIISKLSEYERVDITHPESEFDEPFLYHHVFENSKTLNNFFDDIIELRRRYDSQIDGNLFLAMVEFEHYLIYLVNVINIGFEKEEGACYTVGVAIYEEVNEWFKQTTWLIDKELNKPSYKYKKKYGIIYKIKLNRIYKKLRNTRLYKLFVIQMELDEKSIGKIFKERLKI